MLKGLKNFKSKIWLRRIRKRSRSWQQAEPSKRLPYLSTTRAPLKRATSLHLLRAKFSLMNPRAAEDELTKTSQLGGLKCQFKPIKNRKRLKKRQIGKMGRKRITSSQSVCSNRRRPAASFLKLNNAVTAAWTKNQCCSRSQGQARGRTIIKLNRLGATLILKNMNPPLNQYSRIDKTKATADTLRSRRVKPWGAIKTSKKWTRMSFSTSSKACLACL